MTTILKLQNMNALEYAQLITVLRKSGSYNDAEPVYCSVQRLADERDTERSRGLKMKQTVGELSETVQCQAERIRALENEIRRLSTPPGNPVGWSPPRATAHLFAAPPPPMKPETTEDRSRMGRQRRELRRLNAAQRVLRMEVDLATRKLEETVEHCIHLRRQVRLLDLSK